MSYGRDVIVSVYFFFSSRRRHTRSYGDWSSDVCSSDLAGLLSGLQRLARPPGGPWRFQPLFATESALAAAASGSFSPRHTPAQQIGRASCRERVEIPAGAVSLK